jgi:hypothetical protein
MQIQLLNVRIRVEQQRIRIGRSELVAVINNKCITNVL